MTETRHLRWSYLSTIFTAVMQLVAAATITRFLQPSDFGLAALAILCSNLAGYFTQLGVGRALVQKTVVTEGNIRAAFTLAIATGVGGFVVLTLLSPLLAAFFHEPRLRSIIVWFASSLIFQSAALVPGGLLRREFRIRDLALCDFLAYFLSTFAIGLPMAMHGFGVWALVGSNVSQPMIGLVAYVIARPYPLLPSFDPADYVHLSSFSGKATLTTAIEAAGGSMDILVMGRLVNSSSVGIYGRSLTLSTQPCYQFSMGLTRVFIPSLARAQERSPTEGLRLLVRSERQLLSIIFPLCAAAAGAAPTIIPVVFGRHWTGAIPVYQVLCLVAALDSSFDLPAVQLEVANQFRHKIALQTVFAFVFGLCILVLAPRGGVLAVALAYAVLQATRSLLFHFLSARSSGVGMLTLLGSWVPGLLCAAALAAAVCIAQRYIPAATPAAGVYKLVAMVLLSAVIMIYIYRRFYFNTVYTEWRALLTPSPFRRTDFLPRA